MIQPIQKPKKRKKNPLHKECMKLWAEAVKLRADNKCEYQGCHKSEYLNAHHVFSKSRQSTRYDTENGICLCSRHHSFLHESAHKDPDFKDKILGRIPGYKPIRTETWYTTLQLRANTPQKLDLNMEKLYLENKIKELSDDHNRK